MSQTLCIIMGGGRGTRMYPLTKYRSKPAVPLGAKYRLIDVPISNCLNSGFNRILVLTQYNSESLNKHVSRTYRFDAFTRGYVEILAASQSFDRTEWFQGTADSVRQSLPHVNDPAIDEVLVLSGDQLYTMDLRLLQKFHNEENADVTVACQPVPAEDASRYGIMEIDAAKRITSFVEKPRDPAALSQPPIMINGKKHYLANMGIYFFKKKMLKELLENNTQADFGKEIIPDAIKTKNVHAFVFDGYWSDIGTISSYYDANMMLTASETRFNLYDEDWQIFTRQRNLPPARFLKCSIEQSIVAEGCVIDEAKIDHSIVGIRSVVGRNTHISASMIVGNDFYESAFREALGSKPALGIGSDCVVRKAIIDKNVRIGNRVKIINAKNQKSADGEEFSIRDGIVVIHKGAVIPDGTTI